MHKSTSYQMKYIAQYVITWCTCQYVEASLGKLNTLLNVRSISCQTKYIVKYVYTRCICKWTEASLAKLNTLLNTFTHDVSVNGQKHLLPN